MRGTLSFQLMLVVLMNIAFVHITNAVGLHWLVPMYVATLAAPFLVSFQDNAFYRGFWNLGVIAIFAILVRDAMTSGITFLLEDGLILAAFCQVHLLNVLKRQTGADLLFFNSFLIAVVTSLFCQDLVFCAVFAVYAVLLITSMHLHGLARMPTKPPASLTRVVLRDGVRHAAVALLLTGLAFVFWPRDFTRKGFVDDDMLRAVTTAEVGHSEEVRLGQTAIATVRRRVVMRIRVLQGEPTAVPELWRGSTLSYYDAKGWQGVQMPQYATAGQSDANWKSTDHITWTRATDDDESRLRVRVDCAPPVPARLFAPLTAKSLRFPRAVSVSPLVDGSFRYEGGPPLSYDIDIGERGIGLDGVANPSGYLQLGALGVPPELRLRLLDATEQLGAHASPTEIIEACRDYLSRSYRYLLPGARGAARSLAEFLTEDGGGHCEYFATALAVMLRLKDIPCRVVTGYRVSEWDERAREFLVRDAHAHAWVEAWCEGEGWRAVDATPAADDDGGSFGGSFWTRIHERIQAWWTALIHFDADSRTSSLAWFADLPGRVGTAARRAPFTAAALLVLLVLLIVGFVRYRIRRRRAHRANATRDYQTALRLAGLTLGPAETPRELLRRASAIELAAEALGELERATFAHERARYRGDTPRDRPTASRGPRRAKRG